MTRGTPRPLALDRTRFGFKVSLFVEALEERHLLSGGSFFESGLVVDFDSYDPSGIIVRFRQAADCATTCIPNKNDWANASRSRPLPLVPGLHKVFLPESVSVDDALAAYRGNPNVLYAEPDYRVSLAAKPTDPFFGELWGLDNTGQTAGTPGADIDAPEVWEVSTGSGNTVVAVIDTGVDYTHPELAGNMWVNTAEQGGLPKVDDDGNGFVDDIHGYDFANNDGDPMDDHFHGTHVAGTIGAMGNNGVGVTGINWDVQIMAIKFLDATGNGTTSDAVDAINYAVARGVKISNNSWGGNEPFSQALFDAIAAARSAGHVFVAGAGNGFFGIPLNNDNIPFYPASYDLDNIVAVAASDHNNNLASFSNFGATTVDLAAPGVDILSTQPGNGYRLLSGTSMATPHVAGVIALVWDMFPDWTYRQVIGQVLSNVVPNPVLQGKTVTGGQLNAAQALPSLDPEIRVQVDGLNVDDNTGSVDFGEVLVGLPRTKSFTVTNVGMQDLTLASSIMVPAGFSLTAPLGATTLAFGQSTTFQLQLDAPAVGSYGGEVSLDNSDSNENPFNFTVRGTVTNVKIIDDDQAGFATSGSWPSSTNGGYQGDELYHKAGSGSDTATWTFTVAPGAYRFAATWLPGANRATNAPFTIFDGASQMATVRRNQELAPDDFTDDGVGWETLGDFKVTNNSVTVQLADDANEYVIADAVRIERIVPHPEIEVLLDAIGVPDDSGSVDFGVLLAGQTVTKTLTVRNIGTADLALDTPITAPDGFSVSASFGLTTLQPGQSTAFEVEFAATASGTYSGEVSFGNDDADENPFNFAVTGIVQTVLIVDDGDVNFSTSGSWGKSSSGGFQGDTQYNAAGSGADIAVWNFQLIPGVYHLAASWLAGTNRANNSPFTVLDGAAELATIRLNQKIAPDDIIDQGTSWESLGTFHVATGSLTVQLSDDANNYVIADAIRAEQTASAPEIEVLVNGGANISDNSGSVDFGTTVVGVPITRTFTVKKVGTEELTLIEPINAPAGFTVATSFGATTLAPAAETTFEIRFDATFEGTFSGELTFSNSDTDENPFNFTVVATANLTPPVQIIDNGDNGFSTTGKWVVSVKGGFQGDTHYNAAGSGADQATWTFSVAPGLYHVAASWLQGSNRATNAPLTVLDGGTALGTVVVNQKLAPDDFVDQNVGWENLGTFDITGTTLIVRLTDEADQFVIADAIRVEQVPGTLSVGLAGPSGDSELAPLPVRDIENLHRIPSHQIGSQEAMISDFNDSRPAPLHGQQAEADHPLRPALPAVPNRIRQSEVRSLPSDGNWPSDLEEIVSTLAKDLTRHVSARPDEALDRS